MSLIHNTRLVTLLALCAVTGCAYRESSVAYDRLAPEPAPTAASTQRSFAPSYAVYNNLSIVAGSTHAPLVSPDNISDGSRILVEPGIFLTNVLISPISYAIAPPYSANDTKAWRSLAVPATDTAAYPYESVVPVGPGPYVPHLRSDITLSTGPVRKPASRPSPAPTTAPHAE